MVQQLECCCPSGVCSGQKEVVQGGEESCKCTCSGKLAPFRKICQNPHPVTFTYASLVTTGCRKTRKCTFHLGISPPWIKSDSVGKEEGGNPTCRPCGGPATILSMIYFSVISSLWRLMWLLPIRWLCFSFFLIPVGEIVDSSSWFFRCCEYFSLGMLRYFFGT